MKTLHLLFILLTYFFCFQGYSQISMTSISDFSGGKDGWDEPDMSPNRPEIISNGGPAGDGDAFLRNESSGSAGAGGKWVTINESDKWTGNYTSTGVQKISMDVRNSGSNSVNLRLAFGASNTGNRVCTDGIVVEPSDEWSTIEFSIVPDDLSVISGTDPASIMSDVQITRIVSNSAPSWTGEQIDASVDIDNIQVVNETEAPEYTHIAHLTGKSQPSPVLTMASGTINLWLAGDTLKLSGDFQGIQSGVDTSIAGGLHIHSGLAGTNGGVVFPLIAEFADDLTSGTLSEEDNSFVLDTEQLELLNNQALYINVHSTEYGSGEIRGQITEWTNHIFSAHLLGGYENPSVMTAASGSVVMTVDTNNLMKFSGSFSGLEGDFATEIAGGAHIHMALPGTNGSVEVPLVATIDSTGRSGVFEVQNNTIEVTGDQLEALWSRGMYVNIHSLIAPGGEIRGQLVPASSKMIFRSHLSGMNEVPFYITTASGTTIGEVTNENHLAIYGSYHGLQGDLATDIAGGIHIHSGHAGENGGVLSPLWNETTENGSGIIPVDSNIITTDSAMLQTLLSRGIYVNIHSSESPGGEIRGQLIPEAPINFTAPLTSSQQISTALSTGYGALKGELRGNLLTISGTVNNLSSPIATEIAGGGHLHIALPGSNGSVAFPLVLNISEDRMSAKIWPDSNRFELSEEQIQQVRGREFYANIHTEKYNSGEVRGQLLFDASIYGASVLSGSQQSPPVWSNGKGLVLAEMRGNAAILSGSFSGLTSSVDTSILGGAHIHQEMAGKNGGVVSPVTLSLDSTALSGKILPGNNGYLITDGMIDTLLDRGMYINVHSLNHGGGEIRGQILPLSQAYFSANLLSSNTSPKAESEGSGLVLFEYNQGNVTGSGAFTGLTSPLATSILGGAHIHDAYVGSNGSVLTPLVNTVSEDSTSAVFPVDSNSITLDSMQALHFWNGGNYVNVHSANYNSGELRGQILPVINYFPNTEESIIQSGDEIVLDTTSDETTVSFSWVEAMDTDSLVYQWQWSVDSSFEEILFESEYMGGNIAEMNSMTILDTLMNLGFFSDSDTACVLARLKATDGSLSSVGPNTEICFVLGVRTNNLQDPLAVVTTLGPVPARSEITVNIQNYKDFNPSETIQIEIFNASGQAVFSREIHMYSPNHRESIQLDQFSTGTYYLKMNNAIWPFIKL